MNATTKDRDLPQWLQRPDWAIDRSVRLAAYAWMSDRIAVALRRRWRVFVTGGAPVRWVQSSRPSS